MIFQRNHVHFGESLHGVSRQQIVNYVLHDLTVTYFAGK
jgi:hypothetical protein